MRKQNQAKWYEERCRTEAEIETAVTINMGEMNEQPLWLHKNENYTQTYTKNWSMHSI